MTISSADLPLEEHLRLQSTQDEGRYSEQPIHSVQDAQRALQVLIEYIEAQDTILVDPIRALERLEDAIKAIRANSRVQGTLD